MSPDSIAPRPEELARAEQWWQEHLGGTEGTAPFSLALDGEPMAGLPAGWRREVVTSCLDDRRDRAELVATHPDHGLEVRCAAVRYRDFPAVEWTLHLRQTDAGCCPLVGEVLGIDAEWRHEEGTDFVLRSLKGDDNQQGDIYEPWSRNLWPGVRTVLAPTSSSGNEEEGRCSSGAFPYFVVEEAGFGEYAARPVRRGFLLAVGWPGRWRAEFVRDRGRSLRIRAGQERTRFRLRPGESARGPLIAMLFFDGADGARVQNLWRRWMIAHNLPRLAGELPAPMLEGSTCGFLEEMTRADEANQIEYVDRYLAAKLPITHWWMDAGWYPCDIEGKNRWPRTGTWEADRKRFPRGLRAIAAHAHAHGIRTIVWFEPERVAGGTWLRAQRPGWLLARLDQKVFPPGITTAEAAWQSHLLDLGNDEARAWLADHVAGLIEGEDIDVYRQDFNFNPLRHWRDNDAAGREGLTENHHVSGYLAYWDALRERFPGVLLDSCASGGRRNDLESLRRAVALHPTDYRYDDLPVKQAMRHSLFQWMPFFGGPVLPLERVDAYAFRSTMGLSTVVGFDLRREELDLDLLRRLMAEWHEVAPLYYGDFYPLTAYSRGQDAWMAWQFHRSEHGDGLIQVFRREASPFETAVFPLAGIDADAAYELKDYDEPDVRRCAGGELLAGLRLTMPRRRSARTIRYRLTSEAVPR